MKANSGWHPYILPYVRCAHVAQSVHGHTKFAPSASEQAEHREV